MALGTVYGDDASEVFGRFSLDAIRESDFKSFLITESYANDTARANTIWTQAREYYFEDTGTLTARPHKTPVNAFCADRIFREFGAVPLVTSEQALIALNATQPGSPFMFRGGGGSDNVQSTTFWFYEAGLVGVFVVVSHGNFCYGYVAENTP